MIRPCSSADQLLCSAQHGSTVSCCLLKLQLHVLQDHWWLSGISRDVVLLAKPAAHIADYAVTTPLAFAADGSLESAR